MRLAVLGDPLAFTRSPDLHRAGLAALGLPGESEALRTPVAGLPDRLRALAASGCTGVNLTHPLKEAVLPLLARLSDDARVSRSVNTVGFDPAGWWGETTDGPGFIDLLRTLERDPEGERVVLHGSGGASRSLALALVRAGCADVAVVSRDPARGAEAWAALPEVVRLDARGREVAERHAAATLVVNATPVSSEREPVEPGRLGTTTLCMDLTYGPRPTPWVSAARSADRPAMDGLGLLVHQARRSLALWTGRDVPVEPLARAVGWVR